MELGCERIGELAKVLGQDGVEAVAKTGAALSIVKAAEKYEERAGEW